MPRAYVEHTYIKRGSQNFATVWSVLRQAGLVYTFQLSMANLGWPVVGNADLLMDPQSAREAAIALRVQSKERYVVWKKAQAIARSREDALALYRAFLGLR